jgi:hypothetical protein
LAPAEVYDGGSRGKAARIGGVGLQTVRDWVLRIKAAGPDGLVDGKALGKPAKLGDAHTTDCRRINEPAARSPTRWAAFTEARQRAWPQRCRRRRGVHCRHRNGLDS